MLDNDENLALDSSRANIVACQITRDTVLQCLTPGGVGGAPACSVGVAHADLITIRGTIHRKISHIAGPGPVNT
jgi:hypothetical protein